MTDYFVQAFIYLVAAVIAVPLARRFGLGSVLGYLVAGVVIGPMTGLVGQETVTLQHFAEFGVVMMLFLVGMELDPKSLWAMRNRLLGLGGLQVTLTAAVATGFAWSLGMAWQTAVAVGFLFSLSSTAIVLQTLTEKGLVKTEGGQSAFSVLLFQDIAVIPMLAVIPLLAVSGISAIGAERGHSSLSLFWSSQSGHVFKPQLPVRSPSVTGSRGSSGAGNCCTPSRYIRRHRAVLPGGFHIAGQPATRFSVSRRSAP